MPACAADPRGELENLLADIHLLEGALQRERRHRRDGHLYLHGLARLWLQLDAAQKRQREETKDGHN